MIDTKTSIDNRVLVAARLVRECCFPKRKAVSPDWILIHAVRDLVSLHPAESPVELSNLMMTRLAAGSPDLMSLYSSAALTLESEAGRPGSAGIFSGRREFSFDKLSAMAAFFTHFGQKVSVERLSCLLFYSDFINFAGSGRSMSGAKYVRRVHGPVIDRCDDIFRTLVSNGVLKINSDSGSKDEFTSPRRPSIEDLSILEITTLHWIHAEFGNWPESEFLRYTEQECVYRFTRRDRFISYAYAPTIRKLPEQMPGSMPSSITPAAWY